MGWSFIFIGVNFAAFILQNILGTPLIFMFIPALALEMPWMFVTSIFLHGGLTHLIINLIALAFLGAVLEGMLGAKRFLLLYLSAGVVGNLLYMVTALNPFTPAVGASGAIYGIMGTLATLRPRMLVLVGIIPLPIIVVALGYAIIDITGMFAQSQIAHGAHLGGLILGVAYGLHLRRKVKRSL
ncbi:MAG: rhomboid family intramembrane serine protease [Candidatus Bathyarchaeia archaeon]